MTDRADLSTRSASVGGEGKAIGKGVFHFVHRDAEGNFIDEWDATNVIVNNALDAYLQARLKGDASVSISTWYVGLIQGTTATVTLNSSDTMTTVTWTESTNYSQATRPTWASGAVANQSVSNSTSTATFSINASSTTAGAFLGSTNTKGVAGTTNDGGVLHSQVKFSQTRSLSSGDTLDVTYTQTMAFSST